MDIEAIVRKYAGDSRLFGDVMRAALTELAAGYEAERKNTAHQIDACMRDNVSLRKRIRQMEAALQGLVDIAHDSKGVAGYHLNGDIADWYSFPEFEDAVAALAAAPKKEGE